MHPLKRRRLSGSLRFYIRRIVSNYFTRFTRHLAEKHIFKENAKCLISVKRKNSNKISISKLNTTI